MKMCQAIASLSHDVRLAVPAGREANELEERSWDYLAYHYGLEKEFPIEWLRASPQKKSYDYAWRAVRWAQGWEADLVYTRLPQAAALASLWHIPTILEVHDYPQGRLGPFFFRQFLRGSGARRLVIISHVLADDLARGFRIPDKETFLVIAPDGVDLGRYRELPEPAAARQELSQILRDYASRSGGTFFGERFTVGYSGHYYEGRGVHLILDLAARLPETNFLLMGGEPGEADRMIELVGKRKLNNLIITGFIPNAELPRYQAACDILLMPYQQKVAASSGGDIARYLSPMKLFEYMACGRAILSSDLPVLREILSPRTAILLPPDDQEAWVQAILSLQENPKICQRLGAAVKLEVVAHTWEARASRILENIEVK
jgi:glycosyltransferase involved in cell wall biosynthesis